MLSIAEEAAMLDMGDMAEDFFSGRAWDFLKANRFTPAALRMAAKWATKVLKPPKNFIFATEEFIYAEFCTLAESEEVRSYLKS